MKELVDSEGMRRTLVRMSHQILEGNDGCKDLVLVGIKRRGINIAHMIQNNIEMFENEMVPCYELDISAYRDDISNGQHERPEPFDIDDKVVIIVDDVLYTGRTVRAALDALMDMGRPKAVRLAVVVDRGHRQLPIRPDIVGKNIPTSMDEQIHVFVDEVDGNSGVFLEKVN